MRMPKISVIIPVYNVEDYLRVCLDSIVKQTLKEIEIICVDDGSTDRSLDILIEYADKDERFLILQQENKGAGIARNTGMQKAKGEYIWFIDADDWIAENALENINVFISEHNDCDIIVLNTIRVLGKENLQHFISINKDAPLYNDVIRTKDIIEDIYSYIITAVAWDKVFKRDFLEIFNIRFQGLQSCNDIYFVRLSLTLSDKIGYVEDYCYYYRAFASGSTSSQRGDKALNILTVANALRKSLKKHNKYKIVKNAFYYSMMGNIRYELGFTNEKQAAEIIEKSKRFLPRRYISTFNRIVSEQINNKIQDSNNIKVSIIIPVYNVEKYLEECLDSVVNQTLRNIEIICVDDCSTDNSLNILEEYAKKDMRIVLKKNKSNFGAPGKVRSAGLKLAKGSYIGFVDSDDIIDQNYFEVLYNNAQSTGSEVSITKSINKFMRASPVISNVKTSSCEILLNPKDRETVIVRSGSNVNKIYKREFIIKHQIKFCEIKNIAEDNYFSMQAMVLANKLCVCNDVTYHYRRIETSITGRIRTKKDFDNIKIYKSILQIIKKHIRENLLSSEYEKVIEKRISQDFTWFIQECIEQDVQEFIRIATKEFPFLRNDMKHREQLIVTLTSFPERINTVYIVIESVLNQTHKADKVILWLAPEQFPNKEKDLPENLLVLKEKGLDIDWYHDIRSYKKLIPILQKYPNNIIVTADDDNIYHLTWLEKLFDSYKKYPTDIHCHRVTKFIYKNEFNVIAGGQDYYKGSSYLNKLVGLGGVLYPPHCFYRDILNEELFMTLAPTNDDQWFWVQAVLNGRKVRVVENPIIKANYIEGTQESGLTNINDKGEKLFWKDFNRLVTHYPMFQELLKLEQKVVDSEFLKNTLENETNILKNQLNRAKDELKSMQNSLSFQVGKKVTFFPRKIRGLISCIKEHGFLYTVMLFFAKVKNKLLKPHNIVVKRDYDFYKNLHPKKYAEELTIWYKHVTGEALDLKKPKTFNEKIQWLKLYDSTPLKTKLADKYLVREWIKEKIGEEYLIPLLGVWDSFDDIDFNKLPNQFVLKGNHGCGYNIIVKDKTTFDLADAKKKFDKWMRENFAYISGLELHYKNITPKIIAEKYIENNDDLYDYKMWCYNGKVVYIQFLSERNLSGLKMAFYDTNWKKQSFIYSYPMNQNNIEKPDNLNKIIELSSILCKNFPHVRVDFYRLDDGTLYFGEMTFSSASGKCKWNEPSINRKMGDMITLPKKSPFPLNAFDRRNIFKHRLLAPYYWYKALCPINDCISIILKQLSEYRIDVKNHGNVANSVEISNNNKGKILYPAWLKNEQGAGAIFTSNERASRFKINVIKDGNLVISFKGPDKKHNHKRLPLWIDYKSIKINGKEILAKPVETWHDKPYKYELSVKGAQEVDVHIAQKLHSYSKEELKNVILKLNIDSNFVKKNIDKICKRITRLYR